MGCTVWGGYQSHKLAIIGVRWGQASSAGSDTLTGLVLGRALNAVSLEIP